MLLNSSGLRSSRHPSLAQAWWCAALLGVLLGASRAFCAAQTQRPARPLAPEKFIPTFAIKYASASKGVLSPEETAKFDLLIVAPSHYKVWGRDGLNSWQTLKKLNPDMVIILYKSGPAFYNSASWGQIGEGWEWMKQHHGIGSADRWIAVGRKYGAYLQDDFYPVERLMELGNPRWRRYWCRGVYEDFWGERARPRMTGADGVFADCSSYQIEYMGHWHSVEHPEQRDQHSTYFTADGKFLADRWRADMDAFWAEAVPFFAAHGLILAPNVSHLGAHPEYFEHLDSLPHPPWAAMAEGGFLCPYGGGGCNTWNWPTRVRVLRQMKRVKLLMNNHCILEGEAPGGDHMSRTGLSKSHQERMSGWEGLWFSLTSFLMGFDDVRRNALMSFVDRGYGFYQWFDEFDPRYLHLGKAVGEYFKQGSVYLREFQDGWVVVNPGQKDTSGVKVPAGRARVINHQNFKNPQAGAPVTTFDLPKHRGVILLKEGHKLGNQDNL